MGRKKKKQSKPWCWYCNREFDDEKILIQHQKAKHFKCHICHKKLYTGPGLSIHCMQVHKEAIDKVPNSMPTRSNIEIEIYGMEGIPPEDLKEHEKQKQGKHGRPGSPSSGEDEPLPKKKSEGLMGPQPGMPQSMVNPGFPSMSPMMGPMGPMPPFMPPGMGMMGSGTPVPAAIPAPHLQNKPLFPSAAAIASTTNHSSSNDTKTTTTAAIGPVKPTFPAYSSSSSSQSANSSTVNAEPSKVNLISAVGGSSKIIHPPEDISLEEYLAKLPKYQGSLPTTPPVEDAPSSSSPPPTTTAPSTVTSQQPPEERRVPVNRMPVGVSGGILPPVSSVAIMAGACPPLIRAAPPTIPLIPASMPIIRHPQMQLHPGISYQGLLGGVVPPQMAYGGGPAMFPAGPPAVLTPMMPPRFR